MNKYLILLGIFIIAMVFIIWIIPPMITPVNNINVSNDVITIDKTGVIIPDDVCSYRGIKNNVIVIYKTGCGACAIAVPILEELDNELDVNFEFYDLAVQEGRNKVDELKIIPYYVPTVIINCKAYVGLFTKEQYKSFIEAM
ncbi:MAG: hypothetical protein ACE5J4_01135 [Candidatus Aenigmatarchaeota archaeon]